MAVSSLNNLPRINPKKNPLTDRTNKNYYSSATESQKMIVRLTNGRTRSNEVLVSKQRDSGSFQEMKIEDTENDVDDYAVIAAHQYSSRTGDRDNEKGKLNGKKSVLNFERRKKSQM